MPNLPDNPSPLDALDAHRREIDAADADLLPAFVRRMEAASRIAECKLEADMPVSRPGREHVILCERGIRTFETYTRNTLDIAAIPALKTLSHLPVLIDPSHSAGIARFVAPLSLAAAAAGADGIIVEVHNNPSCALCDGAQSITPPVFDDLMEKIRHILPFRCRINA